MILKLFIFFTFLAQLAYADTWEPKTYCTARPCSNNGVCEFDTKLGLPICICPKAFTGRFCENGVNTRSNKQDNTYNPTSGLLKSMRSFESPLNGYINPCVVFADLCKNGGLCSPLSTGKVKCTCPIYYTGEFCETLAFIPCPTLHQLCNAKNGNCTNNVCVCKKGYRGAKCDEEEVCNEYFCLNNGVCNQLQFVPFRSCSCPDGFTGGRCETQIDDFDLDTTTVSLLTTAPVSLNCKTYTIKITNNGGYYARFSLSYNTNRSASRKPRNIVFISSTAALFQSVSTNIPVGVENLVVKLEIRFVDYGKIPWRTIHVDRNLGTNTECTKCYKFWGTTFSPKWDYLLC